MENKLSFIDEQNIFFIEFSSNSFKNYNNLVEEQLKNNHANLLDRYQELAKKIQSEKLETEYLDLFYSSSSQTLKEAQVVYLQRFRFSIIIQLYSFLETELKKYCDYHFTMNNKEYKASDLKANNDIEKFKKYLKNSAGKDISKNPNWVFINEFRKLRNLIVHSNGVFDDKDSNCNSYKKFSIENFKVIEKTSSEYQIYLDNKLFIEKCIDNVSDFLLNIIHQKHIT
ncbi:MAG: hypothetical protein ABNG98_02580 [Flavobacterium sp.]|jgi:hypothetical protein